MAARVTIRRPVRNLTVPLASAAVVYQGQTAGVVLNTRTCNEVSTSANMKTLGTFVEDYSQTAGDVNAQIKLFEPIELVYFEPSSTNPPVLATNFLGKVYFDATGKITTDVTQSAVALAFAGILYDVDTKDGIGVHVVSSELAELLS
jgi:hypothetical protein